ncbi:MAG: hypothetical protein JXA00_04400 [Candidatus Thermoplasmatota archaeon]|nr:hypothetical protein [Candidatus Thermoplasmatota archaeon]
MMVIVRLTPRSNLEKIWEYVESTLTREETTRYVTPLYATQAEGMMSVAVVFDVKDPDQIAHFLVDSVANCEACHHTSTVTLMKPVFFPIPKNRPSTIYRYIVRIYTHPRNYKTIYDYLVDFHYPFNLFPIYISYSLGDEDIVMNIASDSPETVNTFVREHIRNLDGADTVVLYPVVKAKRFAPLEKLIEEQQRHLAEPAKKLPKTEIDTTFDWIEDFEEYAMLTGAFPADL